MNASSVNHNIEAEIRSILAASLHQEGTVTVAPGSSVDEKLCMDPRTEDPESWACDCYERMKQRCASVKPMISDYDESLCLRAQFCSEGKVCQTWKSVMCHNLGEYEAKLSGVFLSKESQMETLVERSSVTGQHTSGFDRVTSGKL